MISPKEASTVPPGTPGAPMANNPNNRMNKVNAARKSKVDDNTARMQSIKQLGV